MHILRCSGWWEQEGYGRQPMEDLQLHFANGKLSGTGSDMVGYFELKGVIEDDRIYLLKQYVGNHQIEYNGTSNGEGVYFGDWNCFGIVGGKWLIRVESRNDVLGSAEADVFEA